MFNFAETPDTHYFGGLQPFRKGSINMTEDIQVVAELSVPHFSAVTSDDVLQHLGDLAIKHGYAKEGYVDALLKREHEYPTGLPMIVPIALPHTDAHHILKAGLGIVTLASPVTFKEMGGSNDEVSVQAVILILVTNPSSQVEVLSRLISAVQNESWFPNVKAATSDTELAAAFNAVLEQHTEF